MALLVLEGHDLGLDAGTVPGTDAFDDAGVDGTAVQIAPDDGMRILIGIGQPAGDLVFRCRFCGKGEGLGILVPQLDLHFGEVHGAGVDPGRRAGLEPPHGKTKLTETVSQSIGGSQTVGTGMGDSFTGEGHAFQIGAGGQYHGTAGKDRTGGGGHGGDLSVLHAQIHHFRLTYPEMILLFQRLFHHFLIMPPVRLRTQGIDGGPLAPVEHPVLDAGLVGGHAHLSAHGIQLPHQMALAGASDGRIAGHVAHTVQIHGKAYRVQAHPCGGKSRLDAGVSGADDGDITLSCVICLHGQTPLLRNRWR